MLWETEENSVNSETMGYTTEKEELEKKLLPYDILGNIAHVGMLQKQGYLTGQELEAVEGELNKLYSYEGEIDSEDVHTFVEEKVTEETEAGKKIHAGRSRNDQVALDTRLLMKDSSIEIALNAIELVEEIQKFSGQKNQLIPGYTHQQQAMPSSTGLWASSFADALIDDLKLLKSSYQVFDSSPLGAAASYGTSLDIDRDFTAELLGFRSVQQNTLYCGNRGKQELMMLQALSQIMLDLQKMAEDLINFSEDQQFFEIPEEYCTGSSIMPQKKNPDALEMVRAKAEEVNASVQATRGVIAKLPSGYNKDSQQTKKHLIQSIETVNQTLKIMTGLVSDLELSDDYDVKKEIFAAQTANEKVEEGTPFREAYKEVKQAEDYVEMDKMKEPQMQDYCGIKEFWEHEKTKFDQMKSDLLK